MIRKVGSPAQKWKVLVVDRESLRVLAAALPVNDLVNEGITIVEMLDMRREPLPRLPALYFITPSAESVQQLTSENPAQYKEFHLFFTSRLPDFQMDVLRGNPSLLRRVRALVELDVSFLALESRVFSLGRPASSIPQMYAEQAKPKDEMATVSELLTDTCQIVAPRLDWTVRSAAKSNAARTVAALVKEQLDAARIQRDANDDDAPDAAEEHVEQDDERRVNKATLLIVDRAADLVSPLVHEFSYQAMAHDLLSLNYRKPGGAHVEMPDEKNPEKTNSVQLDDEEKDPVWGEIRSLFVEEALQKAQAAFRGFLENDAAFKIRGKGAGEVDIKDMSAAVRSLPNSQLKADKFAMHIKAARECLEICQRDSLQDLALVEQDLVTGTQPDGSKVRPEFMIETLLEILGDESIPVMHRARLVMIAHVVAGGLPGLGGENSNLALSASFRSRVRRAQLDNYVESDPAAASALSGLLQVLEVAKASFQSYESQRNPKAQEAEDADTVAGKLRQKYAHRQAKKQHLKDSAARRRRHGLQDEGSLEYDVARYHPPLRSVMMDLVDDELDSEEFPTTGTVSVDSIIASLGTSASLGSSKDGHSNRVFEKEALRHGLESVRQHSGAVAGMVKSFGKSDSGHSKTSDDDGRFRLAESDHLYMVFVLGGICYSEVKSMYEVCNKRDANLLLGGSLVLTPNNIMEFLGSVADPVLRIRVMLPPLPIELAMSRAARAKAIEAGRAKQATAAAAAAKRGEDSGTSSSRPMQSSERTESEGPEGDERDMANVEVVVGYNKKSRAKRLFGRRKK